MLALLGRGGGAPMSQQLRRRSGATTSSRTCAAAASGTPRGRGRLPRTATTATATARAVQATQQQKQEQQQERPNATSSADSNQAYLDSYAAPVARSRSQVYASAEELFCKLLLTPGLDAKLRQQPGSSSQLQLQREAHVVETAVAEAIRIAYGSTSTGGSSADDAASEPAASEGESGCTALDSDDQCAVDWSLDGADNSVTDANTPAAAGGAPPASASVDSLARAAVALDSFTGESFDAASAHTFLQRVLYRINRLNHFWYDDLDSYVNERSAWLAQLRDTIEGPWQQWELEQLLASPPEDVAVAPGWQEGAQPEAAGLEGYRALSPAQLKEGLRARFAADVDPPLSPAQQYVSHQMDTLGYCHLLAVGSVDGLVEASRQSRVCAGAANPVSCAIFRVLMEEYGTGRYSKKHSTFYKLMMEELGLNTKEEAYLDLLPWQWLAGANQNFLITERRRHYLRYAGALTFFEINGPSVYKTYLAAGRRNGLSDEASGYWQLHIKEDERHGRQMLEEVALPLVDMYPNDAWELLLGYDQDRFMGGRAGAALVQHIQVAAALSAQAGKGAAA